MIVVYCCGKNAKLARKLLKAGGDDETRTRDLCRDSGTINGNCLKLRDTDGSPKPRKGTLGTNKWTIIGPK
jgi:hypothetical protein